MENLIAACSSHLAKRAATSSGPQDPFTTLPEELVLGIFSHLDFATLGKVRLVSKDWKQVASDERITKKTQVYEKAVNSKKWAQWRGKEAPKDEDLKKEWEALPWNIAGILESPCPAFPGKRVMDTHMLVWMDDFTLRSLGELAKKHFPETKMGYGAILASIVEKQGDKSIDNPRWVLMTKNVLLGSIGKRYVEQQEIIADLAKRSQIGYEVPQTLEAAVCILSQYFDSKTRLFSNSPRTYIRCKEKFLYYQTVIGGFSPAGLCVQGDFDCHLTGIAALRKF